MLCKNGQGDVTFFHKAIGMVSDPTLLALYVLAVVWSFPRAFRLVQFIDGWPSACGRHAPAAPDLRPRGDRATRHRAPLWAAAVAPAAAGNRWCGPRRPVRPDPIQPPRPAQPRRTYGSPKAIWSREPHEPRAERRSGTAMPWPCSPRPRCLPASPQTWPLLRRCAGLRWATLVCCRTSHRPPPPALAPMRSGRRKKSDLSLRRAGCLMA